MPVDRKLEAGFKVEPVLDGAFINTMSALIRYWLIFLFDRCSHFIVPYQSCCFVTLYVVPVNVYAIVYSRPESCCCVHIFFFTDVSSFELIFMV